MCQETNQLPEASGEWTNCVCYPRNMWKGQRDPSGSQCIFQLLGSGWHYLGETSARQVHWLSVGFGGAERVAWEGKVAFQGGRTHVQRMEAWGNTAGTREGRVPWLARESGQAGKWDSLPPGVYSLNKRWGEKSNKAKSLGNPISGN